VDLKDRKEFKVSEDNKDSQDLWDQVALQAQRARLASALRCLVSTSETQTMSLYSSVYASRTELEGVVGEMSVQDKTSVSLVSIKMMITRLESVLTPGQMASARCKGGVSMSGRLKKFTVVWEDDPDQ